MKNLNPTVTVIIPVFNAEKYIRRAIESLKNQTFSDFKCHIVNDASTDNSLNIIKDNIQNDGRFKLINLKENKGVAYSRNIAIEMADTDFIAGLDADDEYHTPHLEIRMNYMLQFDFDYLYGTMDIVGDTTVPDKNNPQNMIDILTQTSQGPTIFIKRDTFLKVGGYKQMYGEDGDFLERAEAMGVKIRNIPFKTYRYYRENHNSITQTILKNKP